MIGEMADIAIGKIVSPHGVTGAVKVLPYADSPERHQKLLKTEVHVGSQEPPSLVPMTVSRASAYGRFWLLKFEQVDSREEAQRLKGLHIYIAAKDRPPLPAGNYYYDQLIGLAVYDSGKRWGQVVAVRPIPPHDLYVIAGAGGKEIMLPAVKDFVQEINLEEGIMRVNIPEGLEEL